MANGLPTFNINTKPLTGQAFFQPTGAVRSGGMDQAEQALNQQEIFEEQKRELDKQRLQEEINNRRQQLLAQQTAKGITGGLAAAQQQELEQNAGLALDEKTQRDLLEKEFARKEKRQSMRQAFASEMMRRSQRKFKADYNNFQRAFNQFRKTTTGKIVEEQERHREILQNDYDNAVANIQRRLVGRKVATGILGALSGLAGALTGGVGTLIGGAITGAVSGISSGVGRNRASNIISQYRRR